MILPVSTVNSYPKASNLSWTERSEIDKDKIKALDVHNEDKKRLSSTLKAGLALGGLALVGTGVYLATRGKRSFKLTAAQQKELEQLIEAGKIDSETAVFFTDLIESKSFGNIPKMYEKLAKFMGYEKAPELIINPDLDNSGIAVYNYINGTISVGEKPKLSDIYHELIHFGQFDYLYRAFGKDEILNARTLGIVNELKFDSKFKGGRVSQRIFGKPMEEVSAAELESFLTKKRMDFSANFNDEFYQQVAALKGELSEGSKAKAELYRQALMAADKNQSLLEKEAYGKQILFENKLSEFIRILKK